MALPEFDPRWYQEPGIADLLADPHHGLLMRPGLGKTPMFLSAFRELRLRCDVSRALVVAPLRVCYSTWPNEVAKWREFAGLRVSILHGPQKQEALETPADLYLINPEGLPWLIGKPNKKRTRWINGPWKNWVGRPEMLCVDESSAFKRAFGLRARTLARALPDFGRRVILNGTPASHSIADLHGQMKILDMGESLDPRITYFQARFMIARTPDPDYPNRIKWEPKPGAVEEVARLCAPRLTRIGGGVDLGLPKRIVTEVPVRLGDRELSVYKQISDNGAARLPDGTDMVADEPMGKLRQIVGGSVFAQGPMDPEPRIVGLGSSKLDALCELLDQLDKPPIIAYWFRPELALIHERLSKRFDYQIPVLGSGVSAKRGAEIEREWNAGHHRALLLHPRSGGKGLNLQQGGNVVIFFTLPWTPDDYEQVVGRVERDGQPEPHVYVYNLSAQVPVDRYVARVLAQRTQTEQDFLNAVERARNEVHHRTDWAGWLGEG